MKKRVISAIVALLIFIPIFLLGGIVFDITLIGVSLLGLREFLKIKETKKEIPMFMSFISYILMALFIVECINNNEIIFSLDYRVLASILLIFLIPTILYDRKRYSVTDAFYLIGGLFFLGIGFSLIIMFRNISLSLIIYLFLITIMTDTYALFIGSLIGRHKLLESISPNKTLEGMIGGTVVGTFVATVFYITVINPSMSLISLILMTLFLSIIGQFGDLVFSAIKRYYGKKDFSNIMPGHGGILDRLDSIIFVVLGYIFFI